LFLTAALYKFVELADFESMQAPLIACCEQNGVKGTLLLALEGINGTIAGPEAGVRAVLAYLRQDPRLADLPHKESWASKEPFYRLKVRLKKEIVTLGVPGVSPINTVGTYVGAEQWNALIQDPDVVLVDTRNDYEVVIGTFAGAIDPKVKTFSQLPEWLQTQQEQGGVLADKDGKKPKVAMFCTGGIRCEKSTSYMKALGFDEVYHLDGGILKYLENVKPQDSLWQGQCFVFDERVSVGHGLQEGGLELCRSCRHPLTEEDKQADTYEAGISCPRCHDHLTSAQRVRFAERQKQMALAKARGTRHVGAVLPKKPVQDEAAQGLASQEDS
jgi:UPF0176 protein